MVNADADLIRPRTVSRDHGIHNQTQHLQRVEEFPPEGPVELVLQALKDELGLLLAQLVRASQGGGAVELQTTYLW